MSAFAFEIVQGGRTPEVAQVLTLSDAGKRYLWADFLRLRKEQRNAGKRKQPTLFPVTDDVRPPTEKTASGRYEEPTLF